MLAACNEDDNIFALVFEFISERVHLLEQKQSCVLFSCSAPGSIHCSKNISP